MLLLTAATAAPRDERVARGLKEALSIGADNAVTRVGRLDGYFKNQVIKILMPKPLRPVEKLLRTVGQGPQADAFVKSMNRAAEKAAPEAKGIFVDAIKEITFDDARKILSGGEHAATDYFQSKTTERLTTAFGPIVRREMDSVGVTKQYKQLMGRFSQLPLGGDSPDFDLDRYVVGQALKGLFHELGEEEAKIRKDPVARVTDILKDVFGH
jgi:hypothetical protein